MSHKGFDWGMCIRQILKEPIKAVTSPLYKLQNTGELSADGLGWAWQSNVFGHYVLVRTMNA